MLSGILVLVSVVFLDVLLSGDNAVVVGMAANTLPENLRNRAIMYGMAMAAVCRIALSLFALALLRYRLVSIVGGVGLLWVAYKLLMEILKGDEDEEKGPPKRKGDDLLSTMLIIAVADVSMSLDNILAVSALARNNPAILVFGLVVSITCMAFAAKLASKLLASYKWLNWVGFGLIIIIAFELIFGIKSL